jgi:hypothetical protein
LLGWLIDFWNTDDNANKIIIVVISAILGILIKEIVKFFKWFGKKIYAFSSYLKGLVKKKYKKWREKRRYKKTIKLIVRKKMAIPRYFLLGKSEEKNPELKQIFQMIEDGELEAPDLYKLVKVFRDNPDLKVLSENIQLHHPLIKNPNDYFKK